MLVPLKIRIWRQGRTYYAVVIDDAAQHFLTDFIDHEVLLNMNDNVKLVTRITRLKQGAGRLKLGMYLPTRLWPLWEELKVKGDIYATITIDNGNSGR